ETRIHYNVVDIRTELDQRSSRRTDQQCDLGLRPIPAEFPQKRRSQDYIAQMIRPDDQDPPCVRKRRWPVRIPPVHQAENRLKEGTDLSRRCNPRKESAHGEASGD